MSNTTFKELDSSNTRWEANMPTTRHAMEYNMNHQRRGLALIFNHETFKFTEEKREGTNKDCIGLEKSLSNLGFVVSVHTDCKLKELNEHIDQAAKIDHSDHDCIVIVFLTHGEKGGYVYAKDLPHNLDDIFQRFTADKCPTLAGKPKLFLIQACRGDHTDHGINLTKNIQCDGGELNSSVSYRIPLQADFLIAYSTVPDYCSYRQIKAGSCFIQSLINELNVNGNNYDILTLLTFVNQYVAIKFESHNPEDPTTDKKKQMPCFISMLTRLLRFNDKKPQTVLKS